jgi:hypothetical protein
MIFLAMKFAALNVLLVKCLFLSNLPVDIQIILNVIQNSLIYRIINAKRFVKKRGYVAINIHVKILAIKIVNLVYNRLLRLLIAVILM